MSNFSNDESEILRVAGEIKRYLGAHPEGGDSIHGITKWWLPRQRLEESDLVVRQALDYLVSKSLIERRAIPGGGYLYFSVKASRKGEQ